MQIVPDSDLQQMAIAALSTEYKMEVQREGMHQSELSYCLTKAYWRRTEPEPPSEREVVLFSIGFGMERVIFDREHETPLVVDGITLSLDDIKQFGGGVDLKTTRMAAKGRKDSDGFEFPNGWKRQFAAYVRGLNRVCNFCMTDHSSLTVSSFGTTGDIERGLSPQVEWDHPFTKRWAIYDFGVMVVHLVTAEVTAWRITFEPWELEDNWSWLLTRYDQLASMLAGQNPMPFKFNEEWECKDCTYLLRCGLQASLDELSHA